jgi:hypothetical protein
MGQSMSNFVGVEGTTGKWVDQTADESIRNELISMIFGLPDTPRERIRGMSENMSRRFKTLQDLEKPAVRLNRRPKLTRAVQGERWN